MFLQNKIRVREHLNNEYFMNEIFNTLVNDFKASATSLEKYLDEKNISSNKVLTLTKQVFQDYDILLKTTGQISNYSNHVQEIEDFAEKLEEVSKKMDSLNKKILNLDDKIIKNKQYRDFTYLFHKKKTKFKKVSQTIDNNIQKLTYKENHKKEIEKEKELEQLIVDRPKIEQIFENIFYSKSLTKSNIKTLMNASQDEELEPLKEFINETLSEIENTILMKKGLLDQLEKDFKIEMEKNIDTKELKFKYYIQFCQIAYNPFQMNITIDQFFDPEDYPNLASLSGEDSWTYAHSKAGYNLDYYSQYNEKIDTKTYQIAIQAKQEGLKRILEYYRKNEKEEEGELLISGAGPSGLMQFFSLALQNKKFILLESKSQDHKKRPNVVLLGKRNLNNFQSRKMDVELLNFFGVTDHLLLNNKAKYGYFEKGTLEAKIGDIEEALITQLEKLTEKKRDELIQYNSTIVKINAPNEEGEKTKVIYKNQKGNEIEIEPNGLIILEGFNSTTRSLLGIPLIKLGEKGHMIFSFFTPSENDYILASLLNASFG
jgi:hypothetical protein